MYCKNCGEQLNDNAVICTKCGCQLKAAPESKKMNLDLSRLSPYYQQEFQKIYDSGEEYKGKFNLIAFLFGPIWAMTKGCWGIGIRCILLGLVSMGIGTVIAAIIFGFQGTYLYYCHYVKDEDV